jgi:site-specific DNA-adenine methylase
LFLALQPRQALLADNNRDLIATYKVVKSSPEAVYRSLVALPGACQQK